MIKNWLTIRRLSKKFPLVNFSAKNIFIEAEKLEFLGTCYIGPNALWDVSGKIVISDNVIIGPNSTIWSSSHNYLSKTSTPYGPKREDIKEKVLIKENVWIGVGVTIIKGVTIGEGAVIAAGSVVTKDVQPLSIVGGNPAKIIGKRIDDDYQKVKSNQYLRMKRGL